ncbi:MAG: response regulator transcription factor [Deltaproteobacteria bacterium]|nr:MAG: response regulator transcription factor [Deltaproteobacteria bacterium]TMQ25061.1 MAG: response regulator transcription factor [Deltaproteobacteria bacterium]
MSGRILVIEDDDAIATGLALNLKLAGHATTIARDGIEALKATEAEDFALILLDINLPRKNGLEVLTALRAADNLVPVIVLSARDREFDKVAALRLGADDYVTKPFALAELQARIDAVLRRSHQVAHVPVPAPPSEHLGFGEVAIDLGQRLVTRGGAEVKLTHLEFELLVFFVGHPHQVFSRDQLFHLVWGQSAGSVRTVDNFVGQLRKRFEANPEQPRHFVTVRGSGYRFDP